MPSLQSQPTLDSRLTLGKLSTFYAPLAASFFLTIITHSLFNAGLARLPSPELYIAAFAVARSVMHIFESPMIMFSQTAAALIEDKLSYIRVRNFCLLVLGTAVSLLAFLAFSGVGRWVFVHVMGITGETLEAAVSILRVFVLFPCFSSLKFFMQGSVIRARKTGWLTIVTVIRIGWVLFFIANMGQIASLLGPAIAAGLMFVSALAVEGVLLWLGTRLTMGPLAAVFAKGDSAEQSSLPMKAIFVFFLPLVITAVLRNSAMPVINIGLARTVAPELAIAAYAVAWGLAMIILSPTIMFHQVTLNFGDALTKERFHTLVVFAALLALVMTFAMALLAFSPLGFWILTQWIGAPEQISHTAVGVLRLAAILPLPMMAREFLWGLLSRQRLTRYLGISKAISIVALAATVFFLGRVPVSNPALVGIVAMIISECVEFVYLVGVSKRLLFPLIPS